MADFSLPIAQSRKLHVLVGGLYTALSSPDSDFRSLQLPTNTSTLFRTVICLASWTPTDLNYICLFVEFVLTTSLGLLVI
jgi:hypothetical protein